ncbi:type II secretion system F family protein [Arthrobacter sp. KR32]|uniref:Type II secretion system F family protein n=1 Tax=Arthrobacter bussei TaxID=2594179 RepID=A0A7X1NNK6_9MICC|nr:type II secretion system F family protein [Arthrobacter bussei]
MEGVVTALLLAAGTVLLSLHPPRTRCASVPSGRSRERRGVDDAPLLLDLMAAMLDAGSSVENALAAVAAVADVDVGIPLSRVHQARLLGAAWDDAWEMVAMTWTEPGGRSRGPLRGGEQRAARTVDAVRRGLQFAVATGAPSAELLRAHALQIRRRRIRAGERKAAALGVHLVLPLGLCSLPAFICLGVVPVVLGLLPTL